MTNHDVIDGTAQTADPADPADRPCVLLVDPDDRSRYDLAKVLEHEGMTVRQAPNAATALAVMDAKWSPTVVVTEFRLEPGVHGLGLLRSVHSRDPMIKGIVYTASTMLTTKHATRSGAHALVTKEAGSFKRLIERINSAHTSYSSVSPVAEE